MKFEKLHVTGFGALRELEFLEISPGLNIIEGANEAGKTTMLEFVRALFFGFAQRDKSNDDARRYEPVDGGAHGGWAIAQNSHGEKLRIERVGNKSSSGVCNVQVMGESREMNLDAVLSGADRMLYEQIFAFSLDELSGLSASVEQMEKRVYAASSGSLGALLLNALDKTEENAEEIYRKRGSNPVLNKAIAEYKKLQGEVKQLSGQIENYNSDRTNLLEQEQSAKYFREQFKLAETELSVAKQHHDVWPTWINLARSRDELKVLPEQPEFSDELLRDMEQLRAERRQSQEKLEESKLRLERLQKNLQECRVEDVLLKNVPAINYLKEQLAIYESVVRELPGLQQNLKNINAQIILQLQQLGPEWNEAKLIKIDISREPRLRIQYFEKALNDSRKKWDDAAQMETAIARQITEQQKALQRLREEIQQEFPQEPPAANDLTQQLKALREVDEFLRREEEAKSRHHFLDENLQMRQKQIAGNQRNEYPPKVLFPGWWALGIVIIGLLVVFYFHDQQPLSIAIFILFLFVAAGMAWLSYRQKREIQHRKEQKERQRLQEDDEVSRLQTEVHSWGNKAAQTREQVRQVTSRFGWVLENRTDLRKIEELLQQNQQARLRYENLLQDVARREADIGQMVESQQSQQEEIAAVKSIFEEQQTAWHQWLHERELPASTLPQNAVQLFDLIQKLRDELCGRDECQQQANAKTEQQQQFVNQANDVWKILERQTPSPNDLPAGVRALCEELDIQKKHEIRRESLLKEQQEWQDHQTIQQNRLRDIEKHIAALLDKTHSADERTFDAKTQDVEKRKKIYDECRTQEKILDTHSAPGAARLELENTLRKLDAVQVQENLKNATEAFEHCRAAMLEAERQQGEWNNRVKQLEENEGQLTTLLRLMEEQKTRIADLTSQWAVARTAHFLLERTRERFEKERQPAVIKRAGALMQDVTEGRYQAVLTSGKLNAVELDEGERGRKPLSRWSRGTKEQFYLALRLAFIEDYCSQEHLEPLPVVMDDVLVHSDGYHRLAAASAMIARFAEKYQVMYFTCRPGDAEALFSVAPNAKRFRLQGKTITAI